MQKIPNKVKSNNSGFPIIAHSSKDGKPVPSGWHSGCRTMTTPLYPASTKSTDTRHTVRPDKREPRLTLIQTPQKNSRLRKPPQPRNDAENLRKHMYELRRIVTMHDEYELVVGHEAVNECIETAFIQSNCMADVVHPQLRIQSILLVGVPGTGKTNLMCSSAAKVARVIKQPISVFVVSAADLLSKWIGESEKSVRALWDVVAECAPSILLIDEVDGLTKGRSADESDHSRRLKNELLSQMEGVRQMRNVVTLAATNRGNEMDEAFLRRFKKKFILKLPSETERKLILDKFLTLGGEQARLNLKPSQIRRFAELTNGFTGDDIRTAVSKALSSCVRLDHSGKHYEVKCMDSIRNELETNPNPPAGVLTNLTWETLSRALMETKRSCDSKDVKALYRWAQKHCEDSSYSADTSDSWKASSKKKGFFNFMSHFHML